MNNVSSTHCLWDKHLIKDISKRVSCPLVYNPTEVTKTQSHFVIKDRISVEDIENHDSVHRKETVESDGSFCSVRCCKAYIEDQKTNDLYNNSLCLLMNIYRITKKFEPAKHWKTIDIFGGNTDIDTFRNTSENSLRSSASQQDGG